MYIYKAFVYRFDLVNLASDSEAFPFYFCVSVGRRVTLPDVYAAGKQVRRAIISKLERHG